MSTSDGVGENRLEIPADSGDGDNLRLRTHAVAADGDVIGRRTRSSLAVLVLPPGNMIQSSACHVPSNSLISCARNVSTLAGLAASRKVPLLAGCGCMAQGAWATTSWSPAGGAASAV